MRGTRFRPGFVPQFTFMPDNANKPTLICPDSLPDYIAHYRILQRLGKGGMGEVFLGEDTKQHARKVALKGLPADLTKDESRVRTFNTEPPARLTPNHPKSLTTL